MKLEQLSMFVTVSRLGSLSQASTYLHKTQPAISQSIRQLEKTFDLALFNRSGYRLELTEAGKTLYHKASYLLDDASNLQQVAQHMAKGNEISVALAIEASFDLKRIVPLLESLQKQFPNTQIVMQQEYLTGALDALQNDKVTLCITPSPEISEVDIPFDKHLLTAGSMVNVASPKIINRLEHVKTRRDLMGECQIVVKDSGTGSRDLEWGVQGDQRRWYVNDYSTKKMLIESGMGWGRLPDFLTVEGIQNGSLVVLELSDMQSENNVGYYIAKKKSKALGPVAQAIWRSFTGFQFDY